ncbi:MAG TPA: PQQ-dependent sugar dehydrogenase [Gaiellaceae bacterium]|nr:PQQ-dependent sugar dehydrogenase [Gaiellaceae bacterium]
MKVALAGIVVLLAFATGASARTDALHLVRVARFDAPIYATVAPGEPGNLYVVEQAGVIRILSGGTIRPAPFLDIRSLVLSGGEQGLLSVAFDPAYQRTHRFFVDYTDRNGDTHVVEYRSNGTRAIPSSAKQRLFVKDFASNHNGGQLQFGPDGRLYWGNGDGGGAGDPGGNGQSLARPFAKIMRLNINAARPRWTLVAYGLRNPWRFSFDRKTGDLYIGDVGQDNWEEIDYLKRGTATIANFGWNRYEGTHLYDGITKLLTRGVYHAPVAQYSHADGCSVTGGYVYRGTKIPSAVGRYFYGDYCSGLVWSLKIVNGKATSVRREPFTVGGLSSFAQGSDGELYLMSVNSGYFFRLSA